MSSPADLSQDDGPETYRSESTGELALVFSGSGSEYFRIWIVNLWLSLLTLGVYSAWAKVRRERFFHQNTRLAGAGFDYHGKPWVILRGRLVAVGLLALAQIDLLPMTVRAAATVLLAVLLPLLMQRSLRFRLANTSYRGVRFSFTGSTWSAYRLFGGYLVLMALWMMMMGGLVAGLESTMAKVSVVPMAFLFLLLVPMLYASWRRYVVNYTRFGQESFSLQLRKREFVWIFVAAAGLALLLSGVVVGLVAATGGLGSLPGGGGGESALAQLLLFGSGLVLYALTASVSPMISARIQNLCWNRTQVGPHRLASRLPVARFVRLQLLNLLLTIVTLGLYRPFAAVATARMRINALALIPASSLEDIMAAIDESRDVAVGSEAVDLLGFDLSL